MRERSDQHFDFLCMLDHRSDIDRKNPLGAIEAFRAAPSRIPLGSPARLRIKCHACTPAATFELLRAAAGDAPIEIVAQTLDEAGMDGLWQECDCFLSLHRSEGFGLPVAEALSRAIPVIATGQGGIKAHGKIVDTLTYRCNVRETTGEIYRLQNAKRRRRRHD